MYSSCSFLLSFCFLVCCFLSLSHIPISSQSSLQPQNFNPLLSGGGGGGPIPFDVTFLIAKEVTDHVHGGWIQKYQETAYRFPDSSKALNDTIEAAGSTLGPVLLSMSEYLMSSFNESYQSRYGAIVIDNQVVMGALGTQFYTTVLASILLRLLLI